MANAQKIKIINILLSSLDGKIASNPRESSEQRRTWQFTNEDDFKHLQKLTATCDAVFIGAKSLQTESGAFRVSHLRKDSKEPHWFILTKSGRVNLEHPFWQQENIPKSIFHLKDLSAFSKLFYILNQKKIRKIALLGGGELNGFFWKHNLISELHLTLSPFIIGSQTAPNLVTTHSALHSNLKLMKVKRKKSFLFLSYKVILNEKSKSILQNCSGANPS